MGCCWSGGGRAYGVRECEKGQAGHDIAVGGMIRGMAVSSALPTRATEARRAGQRPPMIRIARGFTDAMVREDRFARSDKTSIASPASADLLEGDGHRGMRQKQARWQPAGVRKSGTDQLR